MGTENTGLITVTSIDAWKEGTGKAKMGGFVSHVIEAATATEGCLCFRYGWDEAARTCTVTEYFTSPEEFGVFAGKLDFERLVDTVDTTSFYITGPAAKVDPLRETMAKLGGDCS